MAISHQTTQKILELYARYAHAFDDNRPDAFAECFTATGRMRTNRPLLLEGHDALRAFVSDWWAQSSGAPRHASWHHVFEGDERDLIRCRCSAALFITSGVEVSTAFTATYRDEFRKAGNGTWRISERVVEMDRPPPFRNETVSGA
jgi:3-phenylpropionate/cinnamic acid dioxygenase small subunit